MERLDSCFAVIDGVKIRRVQGFTCPLKTVAIFASNDEFSVLPGQMPERVELVANGCTTREDVLMLAREGTLPKILSGGETQSTEGASVMIADVICFDTSA